MFLPLNHVVIIIYHTERERIQCVRKILLGSFQNAPICRRKYLFHKKNVTNDINKAKFKNIIVTVPSEILNKIKNIKINLITFITGHKFYINTLIENNNLLSRYKYYYYFSKPIIKIE